MTAITTAARLLRVAANELKNAHTLGGDWGNELEALDAYNEHMATATTLEHMGRQCLAQIEEPAQPVCWIRFCSDGSTEGPIMHSQICEARKTSGAWTPLYAGAAPAAVSQRGEYPQLPEGVMFIEQVGGDVIGRPTDYGFKHGRGIVHGAELFTSEQLRAYFDLGRQPSTAAPALEAPPAVAPQGEYPHEQMDAMALARYKVVPSHESMLWSHAVVAGDGAQQLYVGREVECQNMARKFAGAFLDGAFAFHSIAAAPALEAPAGPAVPEYTEGGRESVDDALAIVESFGTGIEGLNDEFARQILLAAEVRRLRDLYEQAVNGRSVFRDAYRKVRGAILPPLGCPACDITHAAKDCPQESALAAAPQAPAGLDELRQIADIAACWGCDHPDAPGDTELLRRVKWASRQLRAVAQAPAAPAVDASDTALLDAMERERIAVIPEFEGPWDAQIFGEDEATLACGSGETPRKAIAEALASLEVRKAHDAAQAKEGGEA